MLYNIIAIFVSILVAILIEKKIYKKEFNLKNKVAILECILLAIGFLVRTVAIYNIPNSLNVDEASAGYEAYSILNYGIDRHGNHNPVFLIAWGGGQNALLTYLIIPFVKLIGLNTLSVRLPMAIIGCISLVLMYNLLRKTSNKKLAIIGLMFFAICPWHIMKSRWGLESNLFPDLILIFVYMLIRGLQKNSKVLYYCSFILAGISAYAYGTSYFFLPIFIIPLLIYLIVKKKITIKTAIFSLGIVTVIALPIILCVLINQFNLNQINLPFMTIPKLQIQRYEKIASIFSNTFFQDSINNVITSMKIIINQTDGLRWNALPGSGLIYSFSIIFTIIGIVFAFRKNEELQYKNIFNMWFIAAVLLLFVCEPNINRINIIWIPIIYYTIIGIYYVVKENDLLEKIIFITYLVFFMFFVCQYINEDSSTYFTFEGNLEEVVEYTKELDVEHVYVTNSIKEPYIYFLFYGEYNTNDYVDSVKYYNEESEFQTVVSFGKYMFGNIRNIDDESGAYVLEKSELKELDVDYESVDIKVFKDYVVVSFEN